MPANQTTATMSPELFKVLYANDWISPKQPTQEDLDTMGAIFKRHRPWFAEQTRTRKCHPAVVELLQTNPNDLLQYVKDWREMMLEWPHRSQEDPDKVAYTLSEDKGVRNLQTRTTLGKYLRRHMPDCPDHTLRDFVAKFVITQGTCHITTDMPEMIDVIKNGPVSCMAGEHFSDRDETNHPYSVYQPKYGWGIAYRKCNGEYTSRALVHEMDGVKTFVRSFMRREHDHQYSQADNILEAWLTARGYEHCSEWAHGAKLSAIPTGEDETYIMPYLDGNHKRVTLCSCATHGEYFKISDDEEFEANSVDGELRMSRRVACDCCGDGYHEEDLHTVEYYQESGACEYCLSNRYTYATGRQGNEYHTMDNVVYCETDDNYYVAEYAGDNDVYMCDETDDYYHMDDLWTCAGSGYMYNNDITSHEIDDDYYHEDHLPDGWELNSDGELVDINATEEVETVEPTAVAV